ncbi:MAG: bifunctional DNA-formamidopyrimidine glycosylase/DNA-(apurinic or apyrimidinic site) lyase [Desulfobacteraceae bacterium]|nr:MAG: bifunctional DNA-formamidopyrimidine glycosylase/DNA-(apurinic or apyrimidinic site) lyase [Desulfobacteraceae bacterium]
MPELPEVQTIVDDLNRSLLVGQTITGARVFWPKTLANPTAKIFSRRIRGQSITRISRRGKFIVFDLNDGDHLLIHLRMTGHLHLVPAGTERSKHEHLILSLGTGEQLRFHDTRKFGRCYLTADLKTVLSSLGPEPLAKEFTFAVLKNILTVRKRQLKPLLLDQTAIAGLGNIYVDEALWEAKLHPRRCSSSLTDRQISVLHQAIQKVLRQGLRNLGTTLGNSDTNFSSVKKRRGRNQQALQVFRRTDAPCPRCQTTIERVLVGQRSTHLCPHCQK